MITISHSDGRILVQGHAGYALHGQDIVCAGVSTLAQTLIASIEQMTNDKIEYETAPGMVDIRYGKLSKESKTLIVSFFVGCDLIAAAYPDHVRVE